MTRPKRTDDDVIAQAAEKLADELMRWANETENRAGYVEDARKVIGKCTYHNSYELAKDLEFKGYTPDTELVEILEGASLHLYVSHRKAVAAWVQAEGITSPVCIGDTVSFERRGKRIAGEVTRIEEHTAQVIVCCPDFGHVREGLGTHGIYVNYEDIQTITEQG